MGQGVRLPRLESENYYIDVYTFVCLSVRILCSLFKGTVYVCAFVCLSVPYVSSFH